MFSNSGNDASNFLVLEELSLFARVWSFCRTSRVCSTSLKKVIKEHSEEIQNVRGLEYSSPSWTRSTLVNGQAIKWAKAKACVYADSVLCVGRIEQGPGAAERRWKGQVEDLRMYSSYPDTVGIDGEAIEFEWKNVPDFSTLSVLQEIQKDLEEKNIQPENFEDRIIFMSMFNDILLKTDDEN